MPRKTRNQKIRAGRQAKGRPGKQHEDIRRGAGQSRKQMLAYQAIQAAEDQAREHAATEDLADQLRVRFGQ